MGFYLNLRIGDLYNVKDWHNLRGFVVSALADGLGATVRDGYELLDRVVVDENHTANDNGNVIDRLASGFKSFKETVSKSRLRDYVNT